MSIKEQELDLVRIPIEENKVLHAILLKAKKNVVIQETGKYEPHGKM